MKDLWDFQRKDVDRFKNEGQVAGLFAYDMALGKTLTATTLTVELGTDVNLIVAPQIVFDDWAKAIQDQTNGEHTLQWLKKTKAGYAAFKDYFDEKPGWYFITWQLMRKGSIFGTRADMVIADEVHEIQNHNESSQNISLKQIESKYRLGLSGTTSGNKQEGIFGIIHWLWPERFRSYWNWLKDCFFLAGSGFAKTPIREKKPGKVTGQLPFYVRRLKEDHYKDLVPEPFPIEEVFVDLNEVQRELYDRFEETSGTWLGSEDDGFLYASDSLTKTARLRELALGTPVMELKDNGHYTTAFSNDTESSKIDKIKEIIQSRPGCPFVVYTHSKKIIPAMIHQLARAGIIAKAFTGDLNYTQKKKMIADLGDTYQVMIATQSSVGTGTNGLQHKASKLIWASRDVKVSVNTQARDRLYRPGQEERIEQWEIIARDTKDSSTNDQLDLTEELVNGMLNANKLIN